MKEKSVFILFPHQLFEDLNPLRNADEVYLIEEHLFFNQYNFHKHKLIYHRASMKYYESYLRENDIKSKYINASDPVNKISEVLTNLYEDGVRNIRYYNVCDDWLEKRIQAKCSSLQLICEKLDSPLFLNSEQELTDYFHSKTKYFQTDFYIQQRKKLNILLDENKKPLGGKWSFDTENRLKYPKGERPLNTKFPEKTEFYTEAINYVRINYQSNYGEEPEYFIYPCTHRQSKDWLKTFLSERFRKFGDYEDAILANENILHHSVLTPMLNTGMLTPIQIIEETIRFGKENNVPLNSMEGFIRQIIGWREFIRGVYVHIGTKERTTNFWNFKRTMPAAFYTGTTGIAPIDQTIKKILTTGYCHHIERLMLLGNFMLLCEINPDDVYKWFMEMFIDAYDWVMVPNVYGMSQFADGGLMATKPYISGSSYVLKMSDYPKGEWCEIWDALFWNFMDKQRSFFSSNPRLGMLLKVYDKMDPVKKENHLRIARNWLLQIT